MDLMDGETAEAAISFGGAVASLKRRVNERGRGWLDLV